MLATVHHNRGMRGIAEKYTIALYLKKLERAPNMTSTKIEQRKTHFWNLSMAAHHVVTVLQHMSGSLIYHAEL